MTRQDEQMLETALAGALGLTIERNNWDAWRDQVVRPLLGDEQLRIRVARELSNIQFADGVQRTFQLNSSGLYGNALCASWEPTTPGEMRGDGRRFSYMMLGTSWRPSDR